jgi:hypothetical protein
MDRDMKWHIYNTEHEPLCWDNKALEFDSPEDAHDFLRDVDDALLDGVAVVQDILFYDGGYINATDLRIQEDEETAELMLVKMEGR